MCVFVCVKVCLSSRQLAKRRCDCGSDLLQKVAELTLCFLLHSSGMMTITTTLPLPTCLLLSEAGAEVATGVAMHTPLITTAMRTTMTTTAMTITTTAEATMTRTMGMMTSRPQDEGGAATGAPGVEPLPPEDVVAPVHPGEGPTSPSVADPDQAAAGGAQEEACSREGEEGYVVLGVAAVEM